MEIFAIMLVKDEADIVQAVLKSASEWATKIFVLDNGSTDGTWEMIQSMRNDIIVPWKQDLRPYTNGMRADVFNHFRSVAKPGDWWCFKLDADEFYAEDPRAFLAGIPQRYQIVAKKSIDYYLTPGDVENYQFTGIFDLDKTHITHIGKTCWAEQRFFRYRKNIIWDNSPDSHYPRHIGVLAPQTILVRHYQFRSPQQMQRRLDLRNSLSTKKEGHAFKHVTQTDWHQLLMNEDSVLADDGKIATYKALPVRNSLAQPWWKNLSMEIGVRLGFYH